MSTDNELTPGTFASPSEEYDYLIGRLQYLELKLGEYSKPQIEAMRIAFRAECKANGEGSSTEAWIAEKARIDDERRDLNRRKLRVQNRIKEIKPAAMRDRQAKHHVPLDGKPRPMEQMCETLVEIRDLLADIRGMLADRNYAEAADAHA